MVTLGAWPTIGSLKESRTGLGLVFIGMVIVGGGLEVPNVKLALSGCSRG